MEITASQVKELREKTGLGMMVCKQALTETSGDMALAIENLRKQGQATAAKRAGKTVKEGKVSIVTDPTSAILYEVNSETDFVARNEDFIAFVAGLGKVLLARKPADLDQAKKLSAPEFGGQTVEARLTELIGKIGENISFRRYRKVDVNPGNERTFTYIHGNGKIGVVVKLAAENGAALDSPALAELGKDLAMQVAAANPMAVDRASIPSDMVAKEKEIYFTHAQTSGKPEKIWDKIVEGKLSKFYQEACLVEQAYIRLPEQNVTARINEAQKAAGSNIKVLAFVRLELGAEE